MLSFFISGSNNWCIRTKDITNSATTLSLQLENMFTLTNTSQSLIGYSYNDYESMLQFTGSLPSASIGEEFRVKIISGSCSVFNGTIQVFGSQSIVNPATYENQNNQYISNVTDNQFIILQ